MFSFGLSSFTIEKGLKKVKKINNLRTDDEWAVNQLNWREPLTIYNVGLFERDPVCADPARSSAASWSCHLFGPRLARNDERAH